MWKRLAAVKTFFALCLAVVLAWTGIAWAQVNSVSLPLKARQLTGMTVENSDGQKVGTVRNLVLDLKTGSFKYVVVGSGGFLGVRATLKVVPSQAMSAATAKRQTVAVHATTPQWNKAPSFKWSSLASLGEPGHAREISQYFEPPANASIVKTNLLSTTGGETGTNAAEPELKFASDIIGMRVVNQKQEKIGEVVDLLVDFGKPRPAFAIISSGRLFHKEDHQYAVPLRTLIRSQNARKLTLNADAATLQQAPPFNQQVWETRGKSASTQIYQYSPPED